MISYNKRDKLVRQIDYVSRFDAALGDREALYGLPQDVAFCTQCVISNQRPNSTVEFEHTCNSNKITIFLDDKGVCDACRYADQKEAIDWEARERELETLLDKHRRTDGQHDCIVSGSGGKDSAMAGASAGR